MKKLFALLLALAALAVGSAALGAPASAQVPAAATDYNLRVAPITCESYTACSVVFYGGTSAPNDGYWMARRYGGGPWVRLTSVPGANNQSVAPIYCLVEDDCTQDYYPCNIYIGGCYWMAKFNANPGAGWYRETLVNGQ